MDVSIKRLGPGDEATLELLAREDPDFDVAGRGEPLEPLKPVLAQRYLANPAVLHWVALEGQNVAGFLYCVHLPLRSGSGQEVLLYEIGVRQSYRRKGIGRALIAHLERWMQATGVTDIWLGADNDVARQFYLACGFTVDDPQSVFMTRAVERGAKKAVSTLISPG